MHFLFSLFVRVSDGCELLASLSVDWIAESWMVGVECRAVHKNILHTIEIGNLLWKPNQLAITEVETAAPGTRCRWYFAVRQDCRVVHSLNFPLQQPQDFVKVLRIAFNINQNVSSVTLVAIMLLDAQDIDAHTLEDLQSSCQSAYLVLECEDD